MNTQSTNQLQIEQLSFEQLSQVQDLSSSGSIIQNYIKGSQWIDSYNCVTELRKINKFNPEYIPNILDRYSETLLDLLNNGKTLLVKNILKLIKQLFDAGQRINVEKAVYAFLPVLIRKAATQVAGYMKNSAQETLTSFANNCGYEASFIITSEFCCDKNASIAQFSIKLLAVLIQNVGSGIMQLGQSTLVTLMKALSLLIEGKRNNLKVSALDICIFACNSIGSDNYLKLIQFCLREDEAISMKNSMQTHRTNKQKPTRLKQALQSRQTQKFNANFFNDKSNFVPLQEKNLNMDNQNYDPNNYGNGYNNGYNNYNNNGYNC